MMAGTPQKSSWGQEHTALTLLLVDRVAEKEWGWELERGEGD